MRAIKLFAVFCLTISLGAASVFGQEPKTSNEKSETAKTEAVAKDSNGVQPVARRSDDRYRIGYQDTVEVTVYKHADFGGTFNVSSEGTILLPRVPEPIVVVCKTERQLADEIAEKHKTILRNPFVNVRAVEQRSQSFAVIGAVEKPGSFFLNRRIRLLELLSFAGGPDSEKAGTKLIVARTGSSSVCKQKGEDFANMENTDLTLYQYKIRDVLEGKENLWMQPGDIVSVLDFDLVYVYGNVNKQGSVKLKQPLTLRQAIIEAEGFKPASKKDKIKILRQKPDNSDWEVFTFDLKEIDSGKVKDPFLLPNDIVAVSEDATKSILNSVTKAITGGLPSLFYRVP
ncbi:MAG TPA: polysaccharide biosynthesis/export family protein [Pyrinomonadaceae bacterium]|jgi:polysaccharide export outer membrane protein